MNRIRTSEDVGEQITTKNRMVTDQSGQEQEKLETREDFVQLLFQILNPLKQFYTSDKSGLKIGDTSAHYEEESARMEGFLRPLWALVPFFAGGSENKEFLQIYQEGIIVGTTPNAPGYWGKCHDYDQRFVEMASLSAGILFAREYFWDFMNEEQQDNFVQWISQINRYECCSCNWQFFRVLVNIALQSVNMPFDEVALRESLEFIDRCYTGNGWYKDGENGQSDYYVPFGMQFYGILYAMKMQEIDPQGCRKFIKRAEAFGKEFVYWFDEDGSALPYGRSQTYRFAQCAFYSLCIAAGIEPLPLGVMKGILVRNLEFWMKQPVFDRAGLLTIGYAYPNLTMAESYNAPGSAYWCMKSFFCLLLPENDSFWKTQAMPLPELEQTKLLQNADMLMVRHEGHVVAYPGGRLTDRAHTHTEEKYAKFAYSTKYGFSVMHSQLSLTEAAPDSVLGFELAGHIFVRGKAEEYHVSDKEIESIWSPLKGIMVHTRIIPSSHGQLRVHDIESVYDCQAFDAGFAVVIPERKGYGCDVACLSGGGSVETINPEPNTNLLFTKTKIPMVFYQIHKGSNHLETVVSWQ